MRVPPSKAIHTGCYRVDAAGKEIARGQNIREAKLKAIEYLKKHEEMTKYDINIWYLGAYVDPLKVDNDLSIYQNVD